MLSSVYYQGLYYYGGHTETITLQRKSPKCPIITTLSLNISFYWKQCNKNIYKTYSISWTKQSVGKNEIPSLYIFKQTAVFILKGEGLKTLGIFSKKLKNMKWISRPCNLITSSPLKHK